MRKRIVKKALVRTLPVMVGYLIIGFGFGILLRGAGYGLLWALAMSIFIYAGSMQYVGVSLIAGPASLLTAALTTLLINARHLFYSISMLERYKKAGRAAPYLIFALTDETYALLSETPEDADSPRFELLVSLFDHLYWVLGTALGSLFAAALPFDTRGVGFSMTALFVAAYTEQWVSGENRAPAVIGLAVTLAARLLFGRELFLLPSMAVITLLLLLFRRRLSRKEADSHES